MGPTTWIKGKVSKKKRRFNEDGFDLDLTYINDEIVAMGFPSENVEGVYRNNMKEVQRFFNKRHGKNFKVYNLCSERSYDHAKFEGRVAVFAFDDHNAPEFNLIKAFCDDVEQWIKATDKGMAAIHCKAGKGRTGVMISAYLLHVKKYTSPAEALKFYGLARTHNAKGVTIPSQRRYVAYYSYLLNRQFEYKPVTIFFKGITLNGMMRFDDKTASPCFTIRGTGANPVTWYESMVYSVGKGHQKVVMMTEKEIPLVGDVKIEVFHKKKSNKLCHFWINTFFHNGPKFTIEKEEIDKINKDKKHKACDADFSIDIHFSGEYVREDGDMAGKIDIAERPDLAAAAVATAPGSDETWDDDRKEALAKEMKAVSLDDKPAAAESEDRLKKRGTVDDIIVTPIEADGSGAASPTGGDDSDLSDNEDDQAEWKGEDESPPPVKSD